MCLCKNGSSIYDIDTILRRKTLRESLGSRREIRQLGCELESGRQNQSGGFGPAPPAILTAIHSAGVQELTHLPKGHEWYDFPLETSQKIKMIIPALDFA
jgi:hypothetical protein